VPLTIVSHNAYWFQGSPTCWEQERAAACADVLERLAALYARLRPDVLCLQEVPDLQTAEWIGSRLAMRFCFTRGGKLPEYGAAAFSHCDRADLESLTAALGPSERTCLRAGVVDDSGGTVTVVAVHLPSNRFAPFRQAEPQRLAELAMAMKLCGEPDLVVGDFNAVPDSAPHRYMMSRGYRDAPEILGYATPWTTRTDRVDYVWVAANLVPRIRQYRIIGPGEFTVEIGGVQRMLSDHLPQVVTLD
jgi:endonuclease/exonuclease/phosphatase family metal-dependent hydrolase